MTTLDTLRSLSAAEEFFACLDVPYDPAIVNVSRLHILRRMGQYLAGGALDGLDDAEVRTKCREYLQRAHDDFVASTPIQERLFKVHQDAVKPKEEPKKPFVPLAALSSGGG
jgi:nitrogenase-stabilizing/protective protein